MATWRNAHGTEITADPDSKLGRRLDRLAIWARVDVDSLEDKTNDELRDALREQGKPVSGTKDELIERLTGPDDD